MALRRTCRADSGLSALVCGACSCCFFLPFFLFMFHLCALLRVRACVLHVWLCGRYHARGDTLSGQADTQLALFSALGRVLYAKRAPPSPSDTRGALATNPEEVCVCV